MFTFVLVVQLCLINHSLSTTFNTDQERQYSNSNLTCDSDDDCSITCDKYWSCDRSNIFCPSNAKCTVACTSETTSDGRTCDVAMVDCRDATECDITCNAIKSTKDQRSCNYIVVLCPISGSCHVSCTASTEYSACEKALIVWSPNKDTVNTLNLIGDQNNVDLIGVALPIFYDQNNVDFYVNCTYHGDGTECAWATIHCPLYAGCFIACNSYSACVGTTINWVRSQQHSLSCIGNDCLNTTGAFNCTNYYMGYPDKSCSQHVISCDSNKPCTIHCKGFQTCKSTVINALSASDMTLYCHPYGPEVCERMSIHCGYGDCSVYCMGDIHEPSACANMQLLCGGSNCSLHCDGYCSNMRVFTSIRSKFNCYGDGCTRVNIITTPRYPTLSPTNDPSSVPTINPTENPSLILTSIDTAVTTHAVIVPTPKTIADKANATNRNILWILVAIIIVLFVFIVVLCWKRRILMGLRLIQIPLLRLQHNNEGEGEYFQREGAETEYVG